DDSLCDDGIAIGSILDSIVLHLWLYPHFTLAYFTNVAFRFVLLVDQWQSFSQRNHILIALFPIIKHRKLINDIFLCLFNIHFEILYKNTTYLFLWYQFPHG